MQIGLTGADVVSAGDHHGSDTVADPQELGVSSSDERPRAGGILDEET
jgi:hypothetical protein